MTSFVPKALESLLDCSYDCFTYYMCDCRASSGPLLNGHRYHEACGWRAIRPKYFLLISREGKLPDAQPELDVLEGVVAF